MAYRIAQRFKKVRNQASLADKFRQHLSNPNPKKRCMAIYALAALNDETSVKPLLQLLNDPDASVSNAAYCGLIQITKQDFKQHRQRWLSWWQQNKDRSRKEWLLNGLVHKDPEIRFCSALELEAIGAAKFFASNTRISKKEGEKLRKDIGEWWSFKQWWEENLKDDDPELVCQ
jgi:hypothetical protein